MIQTKEILERKQQTQKRTLRGQSVQSRAEVKKELHSLVPIHFVPLWGTTKTSCSQGDKATSIAVLQQHHTKQQETFNKIHIGVYLGQILDALQVLKYVI